MDTPITAIRHAGGGRRLKAIAIRRSSIDWRPAR